jgi:hypothetical protein
VPYRSVTSPVGFVCTDLKFIVDEDGGQLNSTLPYVAYHCMFLREGMSAGWPCPL